MNQSYPEYWPQYFTSTIYEWKHLLSENSCKEILIDSLRFLVNNKKITLNAFVIMSNHFHSIWQPLFGFTPKMIQESFMKHTSKQLINALGQNNQVFLNECLVNKADRKYQIWKRRPLSVELFTPAVFNQKLEYIHNNPVEAGLCKYPEEYYYSSARYYHDGIDYFNILTQFSGN